MQRHRWMLVGWATAFLACTSGPVEEPGSSAAAPQYPVGLAAIKERGELRLLTRNNGITYFVLRGRRLGFDYELAERLAERLGVRLEVIVPPNWSDLIPMLKAGEGDIIGANMTILPERESEVAFARPYSLTHTRVAWGRGQPRVGRPEELSGKVVHMRQSSSYFEVLNRLNGMFAMADMPPVELVFEGETLETEEILTEVAAGRIPYTLCDHYICVENKHYLPSLVLGPPISEPRPLAWAVHPLAEDLLLEINAFLAEQRSRDFKQIFDRYYRVTRDHAERRREEQQTYKKGRISRFDSIFKRIAKRRKLDWRILAAQAYQESRFDPKAKTWTGGRGLFGMLPSTARQLGGGNLIQPETATGLAAAQLVAMRYKFLQIKDPDEQLKMALAAYHAGPGHVTDARVLASNQGLDPDRWSSVAQSFPLLARKTYSSQAKHGYVRGQETVNYVEEIWDRYRAYRHATGDRDRIQ